MVTWDCHLATASLPRPQSSLHPLQALWEGLALAARLTQASADLAPSQAPCLRAAFSSLFPKGRSLVFLISRLSRSQAWLSLGEGCAPGSPQGPRGGLAEPEGSGSGEEGAFWFGERNLSGYRLYPSRCSSTPLRPCPRPCGASDGVLTASKGPRSPPQPQASLEVHVHCPRPCWVSPSPCPTPRCWVFFAAEPLPARRASGEADGRRTLAALCPSGPV